MTGWGTGLIGAALLIVGLTRAGLPMPLAQLGLMLAGIGMGLNAGPVNALAVAVAAVPPARSGSAAALINVARMVGATLGIAVLGTVFALAGGGAAGLRAALVSGALARWLARSWPSPLSPGFKNLRSEDLARQRLTAPVPAAGASSRRRTAPEAR
jgi:MFS transporter, DHA2 family, methylenomycin A resistance protein